LSSVPGCNFALWTMQVIGTTTQGEIGAMRYIAVSKRSLDKCPYDGCLQHDHVF
jgi:hypothetical protein